jgi:hypothetical protein
LSTNLYRENEGYLLILTLDHIMREKALEVTEKTKEFEEGIG